MRGGSSLPRSGRSTASSGCTEDRGRNAAGFEGGHFVCAPFGWIVFSSGAGGRAEHCPEVLKLTPEVLKLTARSRDRGDGNDRPVVYQGASRYYRAGSWNH